MADLPTFASVTGSICDCGYLRRMADDPVRPIVFDDATGEYHFQYRSDDGEDSACLVIYHCPFCGGAAPISKRALLFHVIPPDEEKRLSGLLEGIGSLEEAIRKLGKPDVDDPRGMEVRSDEASDRPPTTQWHRTLQYWNLSEVAEVWFTERSDGRAHWQLQGKAIRREE